MDQKMLYRTCRFIILLMILGLAYPQRRIKNGKPPRKPKQYMAYLLKAQASPQSYDAWLCGAAIVTTNSLITSAACVEDVKFMYAIAGYKKYVSYHDMPKDVCVKNSKKKVVVTCVPKLYSFAYDKIEKWSSIDIAVVKVESPFDFSKTGPRCSYAPKVIKVNFEDKWQQPGTDAFVLGWGHSEKWRQPGDTTDYNQQFLQYTSTTIQKKNQCKSQYDSTPKIHPIIDNFMICAYGEGNINSDGEQIDESERTNEGCKDKKKRSDTRSGGDNSTDDATQDDVDDEQCPEPSPYSRRLQMLMQNSTNGTAMTRKNGICQNDHGGPLVTWVGARENLIGVASVFRIDDNSYCTGPYLYTSTECNSAFLDCVLSEDSDWVGPRKKTDPEPEPEPEPEFDPEPEADTTAPPLKKRMIEPKMDDYNDPYISRRDSLNRYNYFLGTKSQRKAFCELPAAKKGFDLVRRHISWKNHPDGPADNEKDMVESLRMRPQIPLSVYS